MSGTARTTRAAATRGAILDAAERLFAEHGVAAVSGRQISEAAGQGNNTAVGYHFGTKPDLVRAIIERHMAAVEIKRRERLAAIGDSLRLRDWVECFALPTMEHLDDLGDPTWFARFAAQVLTDPALRVLVKEQTFEVPSIRQVKAGLDRCLTELPPTVRAERDDMVRELMVVVPAVREATLAAGLPTARATWREAGIGLVDVIVGLYLAEVTTPER
jgi:AcrR family transcriptional regulator